MSRRCCLVCRPGLGRFPYSLVLDVMRLPVVWDALPMKMPHGAPEAPVEEQADLWETPEEPGSEPNALETRMFSLYPMYDHLSDEDLDRQTEEAIDQALTTMPVIEVAKEHYAIYEPWVRLLCRDAYVKGTQEITGGKKRLFTNWCRQQVLFALEKLQGKHSDGNQIVDVATRYLGVMNYDSSELSLNTAWLHSLVIAVCAEVIGERFKRAETSDELFRLISFDNRLSHILVEQLLGDFWVYKTACDIGLWNKYDSRCLEEAQSALDADEFNGPSIEGLKEQANALFQATMGDTLLTRFTIKVNEQLKEWFEKVELFLDGIGRGVKWEDFFS